jgi:kinesin family protein C1
MQMLEEERRSLTSQNAAQKEENSLILRDLEQLKETKAHFESLLQQKEAEVTAAKDSFMQLELERELRIRAESREETERRERIAAVGQLIAIQVETTKAVKEAEERFRNLEESSKLSHEELNKARDIAIQEAKQNADIALGLKEEIQQLHLALERGPMNKESIEELSRCKGELEVLKQRLQEATSTNERLVSNDAKRVADYEEKLRISESQRRKLHNLVQELRGNIRVFARVRPFLPGDGYDLSKLPDPAINIRPDLNSLKIVKALPENNKKEEYDFNFDKVFGQSCSQETLFSEVAEFVQSALDGYHVCLFSYGQTGSGKTHTMNGSGEGSMRGIIPRAMEQVGAYKRQLQEKGWNYHMEVSFLEIYNETIRDLLRKGDATKEDGKHEIKKDLQGNVYVTELTKITVDPEDFQQIMSIMEMAAQHRSVSQTLMNDRSSRSHAIFTLHLKASNPSQGIELNGALNLVDLAGSERVDRSGVTGNDFKETVAINKSLSALADVFSALANKQPHIPYRNSKLTFLLQPALSGDGKTLMVRHRALIYSFFQ